MRAIPQIRLSRISQLQTARPAAEMKSRLSLSVIAALLPSQKNFRPVGTKKRAREPPQIDSGGFQVHNLAG